MRTDFRILWRGFLVAALISPFALFSTALKPSGQGNIVGRIANEVVYPVTATWQYSTDLLRKVWLRYIHIVDASIENERLKKDIFRLKTHLIDYEEKSHEINRLRKILGFKQRFDMEHVVAEVVGVPKDMPFEVLRISKGAQSELAIGMPVITGEGSLGRIIRVGLVHADVQLITDANFHLDVLLQRTRARGVLRGNFGANCTLRLNRRAEVKIGDTLITSGIVGGFPKGVPVGRVVRISYESDNITQIISVEPWVNPRQVEEVLVLKSYDEEMSKIINTAGETWLKDSIEAVRRGAG